MIELAGLLLVVCLSDGPCDEYTQHLLLNADTNSFLAAADIGLWPRCSYICGGEEATCVLYDTVSYRLPRPLCFDNDSGMGCQIEETAEVPVAVIHCTNTYSCWPVNAWEYFSETPDPWSCCRMEVS